MTKAEVSKRLQRLRYEYGWSYRALAKECGLSDSTVKKALSGEMTQKSQTRLHMMVAVLQSSKPKVVERKKGNGEKNRHYRRATRLSMMLRKIKKQGGDVEHVPFVTTKNADGYLCCKLDYLAKKAIVKMFQRDLVKRPTFGDCYPVEQWLNVILANVPENRKRLAAYIKDWRQK